MQTAKTLTVMTILCLYAAVAPMTMAHDNEGFIYGTVETESGNNYTGMLRWGTEEAFWDDLFNSTKEDLPYAVDGGDDRRERIKVFGITVGYHWNSGSVSRQFVARFGDIVEIVPHRRGRATITMKSGSVYEVDGGSNDIGAQITIEDDSLGTVKIGWDRVTRIAFKPTPASVKPQGYRLRGKLHTPDTVFDGWIQWDKQECVSTDKLDGDSEDGELSIEMGRIRSIEKRNRDGAWVELKDGRRYLLEGSNDIDSSNRGIYVEDERFGRAEIQWDEFDKIEFYDAGKSGRGYKDFKASGALTGLVTDVDDHTYSGRIVFDLDESEGWELLNGAARDVNYDIPFQMIRSIEPGRRNSSLVLLKNGQELDLRDGNDVTEDNDGIVVLDDEGKERHLDWDEVKLVKFD